MELFTTFMILCLAPTVWSRDLDVKAPKIYNVVNFGAVGDGKTDDSQAFLKAWGAICGDFSNNPFLEIPRKMFLLKPVTFSGPCKSANLHVRVLGVIVAPMLSAWSTMNKAQWLEFSNVNGLTIDGTGLIDGRGKEWWTTCGKDRCPRPSTLALRGCNGLQLRGLKFINSPKNHISVTNCNGSTLSHLTITAPHDSPNTDGIDISSSTNVHIQDSFIGTGDDCVAINSGSSYINITGVNCGPGHGISVGSLGANGAYATAEEIYVKNCNLTGTMNGVRIKTWQGGSGYARKITFEQITLTAVDNPIIIDQYYCNGLKSCTNQMSAVKVSDITYIGVHGTSDMDNAINLNCSQTVDCTNITMEDINIQPVPSGSKTYSSCINAKGRSKNTNPIVPCLS